MRGRPKKEITRDIMFKVRLSAEEELMLTRACRWTGQTKSEVFRKALLDYYRAIIRAYECKTITIEEDNEIHYAEN